jgi:hypothetical protein
MPSEYSPPVDLPPPDPAKLLASWMEFERGTEAPGQVLANLKKGGLRELLEAAVAAAPEILGDAVGGADEA